MEAAGGLGQSTPNLAALHSSTGLITPYLPSCKQHSSPPPLIPIPPPSKHLPSQRFPHRMITLPKSGISYLPNKPPSTAHDLSYFVTAPVERTNQNCRRKRVFLRGQVRWAGVGSSVRYNHEAKDVLIHLHL